MKNRKIKIRFRLTEFFRSHQFECMGTQFYLPPEVIHKEEYNFPSDIWYFNN